MDFRNMLANHQIVIKCENCDDLNPKCYYCSDYLGKKDLFCCDIKSGHHYCYECLDELKQDELMREKRGGESNFRKIFS